MSPITLILIALGLGLLGWWWAPGSFVLAALLCYPFWSWRRLELSQQYMARTVNQINEALPPDETIGPATAKQFLQTQAQPAFPNQLSPQQILHIVRIIENISFKGGKEQAHFHSKELAVVQDADRLDAIGALHETDDENRYGELATRPE